MFTGLIQGIGVVQTIDPLGEGVSITIKVPESFIESVAIGDSIAIEGVCSTVISIEGTLLGFHYLTESVERTSLGNWDINYSVNLEKCLTLSTPLGGHFLTGHIDECGAIIGYKEGNPFIELAIQFSSTYALNMVEKGSVAIDGISLTVCDISDDFIFSVHLIPHTYKQTTLQFKKIGDRVNLEYDILGKHVLKAIKGIQV